MIRFSGGYAYGKITIEDRVCDGCGTQKQCIVVDSSDGEYKPGYLCRECIELLFSGTHPRDEERTGG
jgi:hypothetical protein